MNEKPALPFDQETLDRLRSLRHSLRARQPLAKRVIGVAPRDADVRQTQAETDDWYSQRPDAGQEGGSL